MATQVPAIPGQAAGPIQVLYYTPQPRPHARVYWTPVSPDSDIPPTPRTRRPYHTRFHLFSSLPIELRLRIWSLCAPGRVIELRSWGDKTQNPYMPIKFSIAPHRPPVILQINQESRREGLRLYTAVKIGVSVSVLKPDRRYVTWRYHPNNPNSLAIGNPYPPNYANAPLSWPYPAKTVHISYARDTIYLGPEFRVQHLQDFLTETGTGLELPGLQYLALDRKLWACSATGSWEFLRKALYALRSRPLKELYIVPDDERKFLQDVFYYREHEIELLNPTWTYAFKPAGETEVSKTVVQNLQEWFQRLWSDEAECVPKVGIKSVRRGGKRMGEFKDGIWEVQKWMGDMRVWTTWVAEEGT